MRCEIEVDIGDLASEWEPVAYRQPSAGEFYERCGMLHQAACEVSVVAMYSYVILRRKWSPPAWLKAGWIAMEQGGEWYWHQDEPESPHGEWQSDGMCIYLSPLAFDFTPPSCDDWKQSKRRIG